MQRHEEWERVWNEKARAAISDHEYDRGSGPRGELIERLATQEFVEFVDASPTDTIFDAGCGSGVNLLRLHANALRIIGMDYAEGAIDRCRSRLRALGINNVEVRQGSITSIPLAEQSVDKVICMSVLQYLDDRQVRQALKEFGRILADGGVLVMHVKNLSSLYLSTLRIAKTIKLLLGMHSDLEYVRTFDWYVGELRKAQFEVIEYNSFNIFTLDRMPRRLVIALQEFELRHRKNIFFRSRFVRRHGSDLKIKARLGPRK
jgi:ubiquinone/menaquinone biosynthesis C-methylase UbiE